MMSAMHLSLKMMSMSTLYFRLPALLLLRTGNLFRGGELGSLPTRSDTTTGRSSAGFKLA